MAIPKFTLYKHVKLDSGWRYCKAAWHTNSKVKPDVVLVNGVEETHREGSYYLSHNNSWIPGGDDALEHTVLGTGSHIRVELSGSKYVTLLEILCTMPSTAFR